MSAKNKRLTILCDCDGVLGDFQAQYLHEIYRVTGRLQSARNIITWATEESPFFQEAADAAKMSKEALKKHIEDAISRPDWAYEIPPYSDAKRYVRELMKEHDFYVVTSPWHSSRTWVHDRNRWLAEHFGIPASRVVNTSCKKNIRGDVFIDDKPTHVEEWCKNIKYHGSEVGVLFTQPYNVHISIPTGGIRVHSWGHLAQQIEDWAAVRGHEARLERESLAKGEVPLTDRFRK